MAKINWLNLDVSVKSNDFCLSCYAQSKTTARFESQLTLDYEDFARVEHVRDTGYWLKSIVHLS